MSKPKYEPSIFDTPVHVIRLGHFAEHAGTYVHTIGDVVGGERRGLLLSAEQHGFLMSIRPDELETDLPAPERQLLLDMAERQLVALVSKGATINALGYVMPVTRKDLYLDSALERGFQIRCSDASTFIVSDLAFKFIPRINGRDSFAALAEKVLAEDLIGEMISSDAAKEQYARSLFDSALELIAAGQDIRAITIESVSA